VTTNLARILDAIPLVRDTVERDFLFASPDTDQRVQVLAERVVQRWDGLVWVDDFDMLAQPTDLTFNVKAFGALGDGVHDDAPAINAAIAAGGSGAVIWFPPGTYICRSVLSANQAGQRWVGAGVDATTLVCAQAVSPMVQVTVGSVKLSYFGIDALVAENPAYGTSNVAIAINGGSYHFVHDVVSRHFNIVLSFFADAGRYGRFSDLLFTQPSGPSSTMIVQLQTDTALAYRQFVNVAVDGYIDVSGAWGNSFTNVRAYNVTFSSLSLNQQFVNATLTGGITVTMTVVGTSIQFFGGKYGVNVTLSASGESVFAGTMLGGTTFSDTTLAGACMVLLPSYHRENWRRVTATDTATDTDDGMVLGGTTGTLNLQAGASRLRPLVLRNTASGTWTLDPNGAETIEGAATYALTTGTKVMIRPDPGATSNWLIVG